MPKLAALSETGNLVEAAARLFETLHELDAGGFSRILAQPVPEQGLGAAINDRLRRAGAETAEPVQRLGVLPGAKLRD